MDGNKSVTANFTMLPPTVTGPSDRTVTAGQTATFSVTAQGAGTLSYQWQKRPVGGSFSTISGATSANYTTPATAIDDNGAAYLCVVSNSGGSGTSNAATLTVHYVQIDTQPTAQTAVENGSVTFTVAATGNPAPAYQWQKGVGGTYSDIGSATAATHTFPVNCPVHFGTSYRCVVSNSAGALQMSNVAALTIVIKDGDNNTYNIVKIGNQFWTKENLKATKYADGMTEIPLVTDATEWAGLTSPGYCWYGNSTDTKERQKWGALYNWYVVDPANSHKIAPAGWSVPTDAQWTDLENYLTANGYNWDGTIPEGGPPYYLSERKIARAMAAQTDWRETEDWVIAPEGAPGYDLSKNNASEFSALPSGYRAEFGFHYQSYFGEWWSATQLHTSEAHFRVLSYDNESLSRYNRKKSWGYSVRLLRN